MAALSVTATSVAWVSGAEPVSGVLGETATAGQCVYVKSSDNRLWLSQCDGTAAEAAAVGILLTGGAAGQKALYAPDKAVINIGATTAKVHYWVHGTAGGVGLQADVGSGNYITRLGYSITTDGVFYVDLKVTGATF